MDFDNLLSGILGAVLALIMTEVWRLYLITIERKKKKRIFVAYLANVIKPGLEAYIKDTEYLKCHIQTYPDETTIYNHHKFDLLPSLNSDIFKEIGFNELYLLTTDFRLHEKVIDVYHCIDYLKAAMPIDNHQNFIDQCDTHFKENDCRTVEDIIVHASDCLSITDYRSIAIGNLNLRLESANTSLENCRELMEKI